MIALILFMPAVYAMGVTRGMTYERERPQCIENATGGSAQAGLPSTQPQTKCTTCAKMKYCMNPDPAMSVFCV